MPRVINATAMPLRLACHDNRFPIELVARYVDREPFPFKPRMAAVPAATIAAVLAYIVRDNAKAVYEVAAKQFRSVPARPTRKPHSPVSPKVGACRINGRAKLPRCLLYIFIDRHKPP